MVLAGCAAEALPTNTFGTYSQVVTGLKGATGTEVLPGQAGTMGWRLTTANLLPEDTGMAPELVLSSGGDQDPQRVMMFRASAEGSWGFGDTGGTTYTPYFLDGGMTAWASTDSAFNSQVRVADLTGDGVQELLVASYYGSRDFPTSGYEGSGIRYYTDLLEDVKGDGLGDGRCLLAGLMVKDFVVLDVDHDGLQDLVVGATGSSDPTGSCSDQTSTVAELTAAHAATRAPFFAGEPKAVTATASGAPNGGGPFVGLWRNKGTSTNPKFASDPTAWWAVDGAGAGVPSRLGVADLDDDGWLDIVVAFTSRATMVLSGRENAGDLPPSGTILPIAGGLAGVWAAPPSPKLTTDLAILRVPTAIAGGTVGAGRGELFDATGKSLGNSFTSILAQARGCFSGETTCDDCGVTATAGCAPGSAGCDACDMASYGSAGEIVTHRFPGGAVGPVLDRATVGPVSIAAIDAAAMYPSLAPPAPGWLPAFAFGEIKSGWCDAELNAARYEPDGFTPVQPVVRPPLFALDLHTFEVTWDAPRLRFRWTPPGGKLLPGHAITLPAIGLPRVKSVVATGAGGKVTYAPCDSTHKQDCWRIQPEANAVIVTPGSAAATSVDIEYVPMRDYNLAVANPDPLAQSTVVWAERPK